MGTNKLFGGAIKQINRDWIAFIGKEESLKVPYSDVLYIEQVGKSMHIQKDSEMLHVPGKIIKISTGMGEPLFLCHSYLIVNISRVYVMTKGMIIFDNHQSKYLGKNSYARTRKKFNQYLIHE
jgi:DNA-binding LytR/AlgR family response regulator